MKRLRDIKKRLDEIQIQLDILHPAYKPSSDLSQKVDALKEHLLSERKQLQIREKRGVLTEFESNFFLPAIGEVCTTSMDKIRKRAKLSPEVALHIGDTSITLSWWLDHIEATVNK